MGRMTSCLSWSGCWLSFKLLGQSCLFFFVIGWNLTVWWHVKNSWKEGTAVHCSGACHWAMSVCFSLHYFNSVRCFQIKNQAVCWNALPASLRLFRNRRFYGTSQNDALTLGCYKYETTRSIQYKGCAKILQGSGLILCIPYFGIFLM